MFCIFNINRPEKILISILDLYNTLESTSESMEDRQNYPDFIGRE